MKTSDFEKACACTLNRVLGYRPTAARRIIEEFGSASAVFSLPENDRDRLSGAIGMKPGSFSDAELERSFREMERLAKDGVEFISIGDTAYPDALSECADAPVGLYLRSSDKAREILAPGRKFISIVGTRDISPYGREWCERIVQVLAGAEIKPVIVSGLAFGVDITAHCSALDAGLPTIAVIPTGPDGIYPGRHIRHAERIASTPGCAIITDFPPGTAPARATFIRRNRIIAGLSEATVVVESKRKGGSLITAREAFSYGRDVYALPGRIDDTRSAGCNFLIGEKMAEPITDMERLAEAFGLGAVHRGADMAESIRAAFPAGAAGVGAETLVRIARHVAGHRGDTAEDTASALGMDFIRVSRALGALESHGFLRSDLFGALTISFPGPVPPRKG